MLLRVSSEARGEAVDLHAVTDGKAAAQSGIPCAVELVAFAEAVVQGDDEELSLARARLLASLGPEGLVDTAAVAANFQRMVRIADATGIPVDGPVNAMTVDMRSELGIDRFGSSANTSPPGVFERALGRAMRPVAMRALGPLAKLLARVSR